MKSSDDIGPALLKLLGVPDEHVIRATIHMTSGEPVEVTITRYVTDNGQLVIDRDELQTVIERYQLIEKP